MHGGWCKSAIGAVAAFILVVAATPAAVAQWPTYRAAGVPRTTDGRVDMTAPAPRTADGKPDLSGVWNYAGVLGFRGGPPPPPPGTPPEATFWNIEAGIKEGLPFQPWAAELRKQRMAGNSKDNPDASCLPLGYMQMHTHSQPRKIIQVKDLIVILYEANAGTRQIFLDGRPAPDNDPQPWWFGYSRGWWEGDTLVVESTHFRDDGWLDVNGAPLTSAGKLIERFRRPNFGRLEIDVTIDDPKAYTRPWTVRVNQRLLPDTELIEFVCNENQKFDPVRIK
ncbi:MAG TPA: hypothetical protein VFV95_21390 [Vicinamibacterales bacterium]|nr:hypothetical protein [Vicinamibacterales bacterium]